MALEHDSRKIEKEQDKAKYAEGNREKRMTTGSVKEEM